LSILEVNRRKAALRQNLAGRAATRVLTPLLPNLQPGLVMRKRVDTMRSATLLAAYVCRYRVDWGAWPDRLVDVLPPNTSAGTFDPYTGAEFGYRIVNGNPVFYSLNDDGIDDGGAPGEWGRPGTDVVLFQIGRPKN
ncbi:MAG: hypothetical protein AAB385_07100, partial [Planctomycetota bacterium]